MDFKDKLHEVVYVPVSVEKELPPCPWWYYVYVDRLEGRKSLWWNEDTKEWFEENDLKVKFIKPITHWLRQIHQPRLVITMEELRKLLEDAFDAGYNRSYIMRPANMGQNKQRYPDKQTFIDNLTL